MKEEELRTRREATTTAGGGGGGGGGGGKGWLGSPALNITDCIVNAWLPECNSDDKLIYNTTTNATLPGKQNELPPSLGFDNNALTDIIVYCVLFVIAAAGNLTVFITLCRSRHRKSRVNLMIMHLAAADLMVTFINIPLEVGWRATTQWLAGNLACKIFFFLRAFGLYLSSLVLVCISLDRYFAIVHPLKVNDAQRRGKIMVCFAWSVAAVCSLPQSVIFHVDTHPNYDFKQCVTFGFFSTQVEETMYNLFCLAAMYFLPLLIIIIVYLRILWEISQNSKNSAEPKRRESKSSIIRLTRERRRGSSSSSSRRRREDTAGSRSGEMRLRRSDTSNIERARSRTLKMTVIIVLAFVWCWTPYVVMVMWYMFDRASAVMLDRRLQDIFFIMAVSNSCVNPIVYGTYTTNLRAELDRCLGRRRGGGGGGGGRGRGAGGVSSVRNTTRKSAGPSFVARSTITKTSYAQISNPNTSARGSGCVLLEIEGDSPPKVSPNGSGGQKEANERLYYGKMQDSGPNVHVTPVASLRSKVKERSLVQNGSSNPGLMLTAC